MNVEVINVGTELLLGEIINTEAPVLFKMCKDDLTKELSAEYLGLELVYNEEEARKVDEKCRFVTGLDVVSEF